MKVKAGRFLISVVAIYLLILVVAGLVFNFQQVWKLIRSFYTGTVGIPVAILIAITLAIGIRYMWTLAGMEFYKAPEIAPDSEDDEEE